MKRKVLLLNVVLLGATVYAGVALRREYLAAKERAAAIAKKRLPPAPPPPISALPKPEPVVPSEYAPVAVQTLFDKSRNPTVEKIVVPPPPPPPVPPFPILKGVMNIGDGPIAMFAEKAGAPGTEVKPGQRIGQFTLLAVNDEEAIFGWNGKEYRKRVVEILDRSGKDSAESSRPAAPAGGAPPPPVVKTAQGPGGSNGEGVRSCLPNDSSAPGAVVDGYRKVVVKTVFGEACRWEAVR